MAAYDSAALMVGVKQERSFSTISLSSQRRLSGRRLFIL
jgi:hypothetical protein